MCIMIFSSQQEEMKPYINDAFTWILCKADLNISYYISWLYMCSLVAQMVKNLPAVQETWVRSLGQEDFWRNGNPPRNSCLGNLMDRGAWWATVPGVTRSQIIIMALIDIFEHLTMCRCSANFPSLIRRGAVTNPISHSRKLNVSVSNSLT